MAAHEPVNEVRLVGRLSQRPEERVLSSGDVYMTFRIVIPRPGGEARQMVDALDCAAFTGRARRSVRAWQPDDMVEVVGSLRRRFFRTAAGAAARVEVNVERARLVNRPKVKEGGKR
jgi:single-strand DNA-binding protein